MKVDISVFHRKLAWFKEKIGFGEEDLRCIRACSDAFLREKETFAERIHQFFLDIPETRIILGHGRRSLHLKKVWVEWYELLFTEYFNETVLAYLWRSGLRHVEVNVDKRFINLGYSFVRQFCHRIALLAARKNFGEIYIEPAPGKGTRCLIQLPSADRSEEEKQGGKGLSARQVDS